MTSVSKNLYIDKLDDIVNITIHIITTKIFFKMKHTDVKSNTYIDYSKKIDNKNSKFKIGDIVRISKYKNVFAKGYTSN